MASYYMELTSAMKTIQITAALTGAAAGKLYAVSSMAHTSHWTGSVFKRWTGVE